MSISVSSIPSSLPTATASAVPAVPAVADPASVNSAPETNSLGAALAQAPRLAGDVALITGAGSGIGRETAIRFAREGAKVVVADMNGAAAQETVRQIEAIGGQAVVVLADVTKPEDCNKAVDVAVGLSPNKTVDVLVHCAGVKKDSPLIGMKEKNWTDVININLTGTFNIAKAVAYANHRVLRQDTSPRGRSMIFIGSVSGSDGILGQANYSASKAGVEGLAKALAKEFAQANVRVNVIAPGFVEGTGMTSNGSGKEEPWFQIAKHLHKLTGLKREMCKPEDIANTALFLASKESSAMTGQVLRVDGGMMGFDPRPGVFNSFELAV